MGGAFSATATVEKAAAGVLAPARGRQRARFVSP
jgi:hypothetical protein